MSLNGNLEDLPLLDILQIVSFSKKTGYLSIRAADAGTGAIVFRDGFVVASFAWDAAPLDPRFANVGEADRTSVIRTRIEIALETLIRLREGQFSFSLSEEPPASVGGRDITLETLRQGINPQELLLDLAPRHRRGPERLAGRGGGLVRGAHPSRAARRDPSPAGRSRHPAGARDRPGAAGRRTSPRGRAPAGRHPAPTPPSFSWTTRRTCGGC